MESIFSDDDLIQLAFLRDEEVDALVTRGHLPEESRLTSVLETTVRFSHDEVVLHITPGPYYPVLSEFNGFFKLENIQLGRVPCDTLRAKLLALYDAALQTNTMSMWESREDLDPYGIFNHTMLVTELASTTRQFLIKHRESEKERLRLHHSSPPIAPELPPQDEFQTKALAEIKSSSELAQELLGSLDKIISKVPKWIRILHVEEILRTDLTMKFKATRARMRQNLSGRSANSLSRFLPPGETARRAEDALDKVMTPRATFHGTKRSNVPRIVRHGFLKPGTPLPFGARNGPVKIHNVQQGSTYGRGIYSSPNAEFALSYSGRNGEATRPDEYFGIKLIVCATLMGRFTRVDRSHELRGESHALEGYDSHMANRDLEYVVFEPEQILPVYVIHGDWGELNKYYHVPPDPTKWVDRKVTGREQDAEPTMTGASLMAPGDRKRAKQAAMARAMKYFPYGFGPKTKGNFVVEDVGEVSDDEEDYGEYQDMRVDGKVEGEKSEYWSWLKAGLVEDRGGDEPITWKSPDEYSQERGAVGKKLPDLENVPLPGEVNISTREDADLGIGQLFVG
ncbi:uncharacterized protein DNG_08751 [Cephalotrichum gorgonifer]|uniref:PARP catalytic domain-containing protein n=1 Tax=Cephalotrichum gorgonifer TaxID=2041049 RepID=A0AAE8SZG3_9PEZI|nr:uncharacterized protein DNG_08751 [Cephalotrichum gorgonifer]